jgi:hypothetical protein
MPVFPPHFQPAKSIRVHAGPRTQSSTAAVNPLTRSVDPLAMAMAEGRREVWNRIQAHLNLSDRDITHLQEEP